MRNLFLAIILAAIAAALLLSLTLYFEIDNAIRGVVLQDEQSLFHFCGLYIGLGLVCSAILRRKK